MTLRRGYRSRARKLAPSWLWAALHASRRGYIFLDWVNRGEVRRNWGDAVAPVLGRWISGREVVNQRDVYNLYSLPVFATIGSMLGSITANDFQVWGSGFIEEPAQLRARPGAVHAVRGPLTRAKLQHEGIVCPELFGDPALVFPRFYQPSRETFYELGVIPHYRERPKVGAMKMFASSNIRLIDICAGIREVADEIVRCEAIISSSLHGMVLADAYGIPTCWMTASDLPAGGGFKFVDYLMAVGRRDLDSVKFDVAGHPLADALHRLDRYRHEVDVETFFKACPFRADGPGRGASPT